MKTALVGICGIGQGHMTRQTCVIQQLQQAGFEVCIASSRSNGGALQKLFPNVCLFEIDIPWVIATECGISFEQSLARHRQNPIDYYASFLEFAANVQSHFPDPFDFVITDYEPFAAQYAYANQLPLVTMDQQSKFLFLEQHRGFWFDAQEEISRLNWFFPKRDLQFVSSFFPIEANDENIVILPPIISDVDVRRKVRGCALVYFSPYNSTAAQYDRIIRMIADDPMHEYYIFSPAVHPEWPRVPHLHYSAFSECFSQFLQKSDFIISTAGHQLISEAIMAQTPVFVSPLETYEQHYNALMVERYGLGASLKEYTREELSALIGRTDEFRAQMAQHRETYWKVPWNELFISTLAARFGI